MIITIDGPAASGKSSTAKAIANQLGFHHVNTGLLYRAVAYILIHDFHIRDFKTLAQQDPSAFDFIYAISYIFVNGNTLIRYGEKDITMFLTRHQELDHAASIVSALAPVRDRLLSIQQEIGKTYNIVADGRDCGSIVYPHADAKIFLTARPAIRAQRIAQELYSKTHQEQNIQELEEQVIERDKRDMQRTIAPLKKPADALLLDNSTLSFEQTIESILRYIKNKKNM